MVNWTALVQGTQLYIAHATDQLALESRRRANDKFRSQTAVVEFVSHCPVHEQTVTSYKTTIDL